MDQREAAEPVTPAWGALPVEQYLLERWDRGSSVGPGQQRRELVQAFIMEDEIVPASVPGETSGSEEVQQEIHSVLAQWRPQKLRRIAQKYVADCEHLCGAFYVLRTYYGGGVVDDEKLRKWLEEADPNDESFGGPSNRWWRVLDDAALFDLGSEKWQHAYDVLPELAAPRPRRVLDNNDLCTVRDLVFAQGDWEPEEDDYEDAVMATASIGAGFLLIVDEQAFKDEEFGLVFRDGKGNIVKEGTIKPGEVQYLLGYDFRGAVRESEYWLDAAVGKKYKTRGEIMRALLPLVMSGPE